MDKDIRFTEKKVDEDWKSSVSHDQPDFSSEVDREAATPGPLSFSSFITSLAVQALMNMGELASEESEKPTVNLDAARQTIDLLVLLREKTKGNLEAHESELLDDMVAQLQMKFVSHTSTRQNA